MTSFFMFKEITSAVNRLETLYVRMPYIMNGDKKVAQLIPDTFFL